MKFSLFGITLLTESEVRKIFRSELREYLTVFNESNENHNKSQTKMIELILKKLEGKGKAHLLTTSEYPTKGESLTSTYPTLSENTP